MSDVLSQASIEVYACEWQDEGFRSGWELLDPYNCSFETDGDFCTLSCSEGTDLARAERALPTISTDVASILALKVASYSGEGWGIQVRSASGSWQHVVGPRTDVGYLELQLPSGLEVDRLAILSYGPSSYVKLDWIGFLRKPRLTLRASSIRIVRRVNACSELEVECLGHRATEAYLNNDVKVVLGSRKIFCGRLVARELRKSGSQAVWARLSCLDYAYYLMTAEVDRGSYSGPLHQVVGELVAPLVEKGLLTTDNVEESDEQVELSLEDEHVSLLEALNRACSLASTRHDFYVDPTGDLHVFRRGSRHVGPVPWEALEYVVRQEASEVVNFATVLGALGKAVPTGGDYTHDLSAWSCPSGGCSLEQDDGIAFCSAPSLRIAQQVDGEVVVRLTLPEPLDLRPEPGSSRKKELRFFARWEGECEPELKIRLYSGQDSFFEHPNCLASLPPGYWGIPDVGRLMPIRLPLYEKEPLRWLPHGSPSWSYITHVDFIVNVGAGGCLWLDGVHITNFRFKGHAEDEESIRAYGRRHVTLIDEAIGSDEEAQARAEAVVASRSQPATRLEGITFLGLVELEPGSSFQVDLPGAAGDYIASEVEYVLNPREGAMTRVSCSLTGEQSPSWSSIFSSMANGARATGLARELREEDTPIAPRTRTPASFVVAGPGKLLSDVLTSDGRVRLSELERWPLTSQDIASGSIGHEHLAPELRASAGRVLEAEDFPGDIGQVVSEEGASGGNAVLARKEGPRGVLVEAA